MMNVACLPATAQAHRVMRLVVATLVVCTSLAAAAPAPADADADADEVVEPWEGVATNLVEIYSWPTVLFQLSAVAVTPPLVWAVDEPLQTSLQRDDPRADPFGETASLVGGVLPLVAPAALYLTGRAARDAELATAGSAAIQAVVVQFAVVGLLKWLTDRAGPYPDGDPTQERWHGGILRDSERADDFNFNPFDLKGGLRWPSGHTASNVALVSALFAFYPDETWLPVLGYPFALAIGAGMVEADYHWLSDVVAGALIGHAIGWVIGRNFRARYDAQASERAPAATNLGVMPTGQSFGLQIGGRF